MMNDEVRDQAQVKERNMYVFAATKTTHVNGSNALQAVLKVSPIRLMGPDKDKIAVNKIRHLYSHTLQRCTFIWACKESLLYAYIGHSEHINYNHYQCPPVLCEFQVKRLMEIQTSRVYINIIIFKCNCWLIFIFSCRHMVWNHISTDVIDVSIKITYTPIHEQLLTEKNDQMHSLNVWNVLYLQTL